ncbi:MAG: acyltransferase [Lachnospiraceae bacterium]|nr:acyltransferase [Lachnospiraceae bacterium]
MKKVYLELLRIIAIFFVLFNHTRSFGYSLYANTDQPFSYWGSLTLSILCKVAVPVFFMVSGAVLLGRQESLGELFRKRVLRFLIVILLFTFLQYCRIVRVHPENGFQIGTWLLYCYCGNIIEPYWFLKSYLSMLLILPFLRIVAEGMRERDYKYLFGIGAFTTAVGLVRIYTGYALNLTFPFHGDILLYPLTGYFLANKMQDGRLGFLRDKRITGALFAGVLALAVLQADLYFKTKGNYTEDFHAVFVWILAGLLFLFVKEIRIRGDRTRKMILAMGSCTFGVYLIEDVVRNQLQGMVPFLSSYMNPLLACILFVAACTAAAMAVIYLVKKIPYIDRLI